MKIKYIKEKLLLLFILFFIVGIKILLNLFTTIKTNNCFYDPMINLAYPINRKLYENDIFRRVILILNGLMFDLTNILYWLYYFIYKGKLIVAILIFGIFYFIRQFEYLFFLFPTPNTNIFHNTHFYSLLVSYDKTNDFYYSGHTGNMLFYIITFILLKKPIYTFWTVLFYIYTIIILILYSAHYTIDILIGTIFMVTIFIYSYKIRFKFKIILLDIFQSILIFIDNKIINIKNSDSFKTEDESLKKLI